MSTGRKLRKLQRIASIIEFYDLKELTLGGKPLSFCEKLEKLHRLKMELALWYHIEERKKPKDCQHFDLHAFYFDSDLPNITRSKSSPWRCVQGFSFEFVNRM